MYLLPVALQLDIMNFLPCLGGIEEVEAEWAVDMQFAEHSSVLVGLVELWQLAMRYEVEEILDHIRRTVVSAVLT